MAIPRRSWLPWAAAVLLLAAAPGALGQACSSTTTCPANTCCSTLAASPYSCVAGPFVGGVQVCSCTGLGAKGLKCPDDKPYCCGSNGLCVADVAQCSCVSSTGCPTGSCCSKAKAGWQSSTSIGTCSLAPFSADGKYCQCTTAARLNGVTCPACCGAENRCAAQATECTCVNPTHCPTGSCCSKTAAAWTAGSSGKCSTSAGTTGGTGAYCDCTYPLNGVACGNCCYDNKCGASMEACPCSQSYHCKDGAGAQAGCCSRNPDQWRAGTEGRCSSQINAGDSFCNCREDLSVVNMTCPTSSQPGPVATCCEVPGLGVSKCGDTCACDMANGPYCSWGQCCTYTAEAGTGICMTDPLDSAGNQVCSDCNSLNGLACPASKSFCCPDGRCVASADQCGCIRDKDCPYGSCCNKATKQCSTSLFATVGGVSKQVCSNCARVGMSCPVGTSYCCKNGKCAAKLEECNCRYTSDCQYGSCCARISGTTVGKCITKIFNGTVQVCPNCARAGDNGLSCPSTRPECCPDGTCARAGLCPVKTQCYGNDWYCAIGQCCGDDGFCRTTIFAGTRQSCANCNNAMANGVVCPTATPVCCARGQCVAKATDCTYNAVGKVYKYQAHHLYYLDSVANASAALDQGLWGSGNPTRPSPNDYYDFRPFVVEGYPDGNGAPTLCSSRWDPATDTYLRGLDYKTAPGTLAWASDLAAQLWFAECNAMPKCKADLATDKVTLARMKLWTKAAADKMISYLQIAPSGRNLLCPPRPYFGFFYQTFVRPYSMASTFYSLPNWASALNPSHIKIKNPAGADEIVSALDMIKRAEDLRYSVPEPLLAMEGLIELLIGYDHTLLSSLPAPILPASAPAAAPASADGAAPAGAVVSMALASTTGTPIEAMDAGPVAPALYAENGFVAGIENPAALKPMAAPQKVEGCVDGDLLCITKSLGLLGASKAAAAQSEGGASQLAADGAQVMAGERGCLSNLRRQQNYLEAAKDFIALYRPAGVWVDPDPAKRAVAIDCPLFEMQFEKGLAVYTFACAAVPDFTAKACKAQQSTLQDFMDTYKAVLATFASVTCDPAATSYKHVNALADGSVFPVIEPGMSTGAQCTKFTYDFNVDRGNYIINYLYERYGKAVTCCASDCESRPECLVLTYYWYSSNYFNIPECGGDSAAVSVNKMPTGLALPPTSGATCGCGDGKGYYGWGVWSA